MCVCGCICVCVLVCVGVWVCVCVYVSVSFEGTCANMANCGCRLSQAFTANIWECVCVCVVVPRCVVYNCFLSHSPYLASPSSCAKRVHTRVLDVPISSSDAKQKISACCTLLLPRPLHLAPFYSPSVPLHFIKTKSTKQKSQMRCWLSCLGQGKSRRRRSLFQPRQQLQLQHEVAQGDWGPVAVRIGTRCN